MKHRLAVLLFTFSVFSSYTSFSQNIDWGFHIGGISYEMGKSLVIDKNKNAIVSGWMIDSADFDPGADTNMLYSSGQEDVYLAKYDSTGSHLWAFSLGGNGYDGLAAMALDSSQNIIMCGSFSDTIDFDPSTNSSLQYSIDSLAGYFVKYDVNGNLLWVNILSDFGSQEVKDIKVDKDDNIIVIGNFTDSLDFDLSANTNLLKSKGGKDVFVAKYDSAGALIWVNSYGGVNDDHFTTAAVDKHGDIIVSGWAADTLNFTPGLGTGFIPHKGLEDAFILKLNGNGNFLWSNYFAGALTDKPTDATVDSMDNVYLVGIFSDTCYFNSNGAPQSVVSNGNNDMFIAKYTPHGDLLWVNSMGSIDRDVIFSCHVDYCGQVYVAGNFKGAVDFDPSNNTHIINSSGGLDCFFAKYKQDGSLSWAHGMGSASLEAVHELALDYDNNVYLTGRFSSTVNFNVTGGSFNMTSNGHRDMFIAKYNSTFIPDKPKVAHWVIDSVCIGDSLLLAVSDTVSLNSSPNWIWNIDSLKGYELGYEDSIYIKPKQSGYYFVKSSACKPEQEKHDSIYIKVIPKSILIQNAEICFGDVYTFLDGDQSSVPIVDTSIVSSANKCDSYIITNLSVTTVDTAALINGQSIVSTATNATFQWMDCSNNGIIQNENSATFNPIQNGTYAVIVTQNSCTDTSSCYTISNIHISETELSNQFKVYPNPATNKVMLLSENGTLENIDLIDSYGRMVFSKIVNNAFAEINTEMLPRGIYFLQVKSTSGWFYQKLTLQ